MKAYDLPTLNDLMRASQAAWLWDPGQLRIVWANDAGVAFWGASSILDLLDRRFARSEKGAGRIAEMAASLDHGAIRIETFSFPSNRGREDISCRCSKLPLADGRDGVLLVELADEAGEQAASGLLPAILDRLPYPLLVFDRHGGLLLRNAASVQYFGTGKAGDDGGSGFHALSDILTTPEDAGELIDLTFKAGLVSQAQQVNTLFGERMHRITTSRLSDDETDDRAMLAVFDDITERRRYEIDLTETVERLRDFAAAACDFTFELDHELRLTALSDEFGGGPDAQPDRWIGTPWRELPHRDSLGLGAELEQTMAARKPFRVTLDWVGSETTLQICWSGVPVFDASGAFEGYRGIAAEVPAPVAGQDPAGGPDGALEDEQRLAAAIAAGDSATPAPAADDPDRNDLDAQEQAAFTAIANALTSPANDDTPAVETIDETGRHEIDAGPDPMAVLRDGFDNLPAAIIVHRKFKPVYANIAAARALGFRSVETLLDHDDLFALFPRHEKILRRAHNARGGLRKSAKSRKALRLHSNASGKERRVSAKFAAFEWDAMPAVQMVLTPAPKKPAAKPAADSPRDDLAAILDTVTDGILTLDGRGRIETVNAGAAAIFGCDAAELKGRTLASRMSTGSTRTVREYLKLQAEDGIASILNDGREVVAVEKNGGEIPLFLTLGRMHSQTPDAPQRYCAVIRDITQWKITEAGLLSAKEEAEQANLHKSEFLAKISHELRTPLNAIIGFSEVMNAEQLGPVGNQKYKNYIRDIHDSGSHLLSLINDLLDLSKIEAGKLDLDFIPVALRDVIQKAVNLLQPEANRQRIIIRTSVPPDLPMVVADMRSVHQILLNLLSNAVKFTGPGGQAIVSAHLNEDGGVQLSVRDTGMGMSEQEIQQALEPFRQIKRADLAGESRPGTGLGLPLTKSLAESNRAHFSIESTPDAGTTVRITFPRARVLAD